VITADLCVVQAPILWRFSPLSNPEVDWRILAATARAGLMLKIEAHGRAVWSARPSDRAFRRPKAGHARQDLAGTVGKNWHVEAESLDAPRDLIDLPIAVVPWVIRIVLERRDWRLFDQ
jgi:hypothetical protein